MNDGVSRPPNISPRFTGLGPSQSGATDRNKQERVNKDAPSHPQSQNPSDETRAEELSLSLSAIRALLSQDLPTETQMALAAFAPLGDLTGAEFLCDRIERKGQDHVTWPATLSLRQALEQAAS